MTRKMDMDVMPPSVQLTTLFFLCNFLWRIFRVILLLTIMLFYASSIQNYWFLHSINCNINNMILVKFLLLLLHYIVSTMFQATFIPWFAPFVKIIRSSRILTPEFVIFHKFYFISIEFYLNATSSIKSVVLAVLSA